MRTARDLRLVVYLGKCNAGIPSRESREAHTVIFDSVLGERHIFILLSEVITFEKIGKEWKRLNRSPYSLIYYLTNTCASYSGKSIKI